MKIFFYSIILCFWLINPDLLLAQSNSPDSVKVVKPFKNSFYAEVGGNGIVGSVNYERINYLPDSPNRIMAIRFGLIYMPSGTISRSQASSIVLPAEVSMFWGKKSVKP